MKLTKKQQEFIKNTYNRVCEDWQKEIKDEFPKLFENKLEVGKWYKSTTDPLNIIYVDNIDYNRIVCYGFDYKGGWLSISDRRQEGEYTPATDKEVEEALIKEAKRRGYKEGTIFVEPVIKTKYTITKHDFYLDKDMDLLVNNDSDRIFYKGKWATIIEQKEMTIKEIEKELGYQIKIVK